MFFEVLDLIFVSLGFCSGFGLDWDAYFLRGLR